MLGETKIWKHAHFQHCCLQKVGAPTHHKEKYILYPTDYYLTAMMTLAEQTGKRCSFGSFESCKI